MSATWIVLVIALWVVVLALAALVLGLIRRVDQLERRLVPTGRPIQSAGGPAVGSRPPTVGGYERLTTAEPPAPRLVLFLSSTCGACHKLSDELRASVRVGRDLPGWLGGTELVVVSDLDGAAAVSDIVPEVVVQTDGALTSGWGIPGTPYAVAIDGRGEVSASAFTSTLVQLQALVESR